MEYDCSDFQLQSNLAELPPSKQLRGSRYNTTVCTVINTSNKAQKVADGTDSFGKSRIADTKSVNLCRDSSTDTKKIRCHMSGVTRQVSLVTCRVSCVTCHLSHIITANSHSARVAERWDPGIQDPTKFYPPPEFLKVTVTRSCECAKLSDFA